MVKKKASKATRDVVSPFRDKLWELFRSLAEGMNGADVVLALKQAGEEIWAAGSTAPTATCRRKIRAKSRSGMLSTSPGSRSSALS